MSRYLDTSKMLHNWLSGLQIKQESVDAEIVDGGLRFALQHPVEGNVRVESEIVDNGIFTAHGIALKAGKIEGRRAKVHVYDAGGIYDPIDGRVQGEHYSTTHFALLSAILFQESGEESYFTAARQAIAFHLRTSPSEYAPISEWMYHWDFQNYAFILTYRLLKAHLPDDELQVWQAGLKSWRTNRKNKLTNWAAMRAWAFTERFQEFRNPLDLAKMKWNLQTVGNARSSDGCFDDNPGLSRPIQYHIFTVAILHQMMSLRENKKLKKWFESGVRYFMPFIDPEGEFNYVGRGHEQIFGYGAAIYALEAAYAETRNVEYLQAAHQMNEHLLKYRLKGYFPLVLNDRPDEERSGWYDYHHLTVYNAFLGVWLGLAHLLKNPAEVGVKKPDKQFWVSQPTQTAIRSNETYFAAFYGGLPEYLSEAGVTPQHIWWKDIGTVFSCPGGPSPEKFGVKSPAGIEKNFLAPIAKNSTSWYIPASNKSKKFEVGHDELVMSYQYGPFDLIRTVTFSNDEILFDDEFHFLQNHQFDDFRFFNFPVAVDKFRLEITEQGEARLWSNGRCISITILHSDCELPFETLETLQTAQGRMQLLVKRKQSLHVAADETAKIQFKLSQG